MANDFPKFQIEIDSPGGEPFPSISSELLGFHNNETVKLLKIRELCRIPQKYAFSSNGKNAVADDTSLEEYISLTPENISNLELEESRDKQNKLSIAKIPFVVIHLVAVRTAIEPKKNLAQSNVLSDIKTLLQSSGKGVTAGELGDAADLLGKLQSLKQDFATSPSGRDYVEAADLTETQWENILFNNRILHGYNYDVDTGVLVKAPKRAFAIRRPLDVPSPNIGNAAQPKNAPKQQAQTPPEPKITIKEYLNTIPGIPSFYIDDDSRITVTETQSEFQRAMAHEGFSSNAVEANLNGLPFGKSISASAAFSDENSCAKESKITNENLILEVAYKFPRVVLDLSPEYLQLSDECAQAIAKIQTESDTQAFYENYGKAFPTKVTLGGFLRSSRNVIADDRKTLEAAKEETKKAAGLSFASPQLSFGLNYAHTDSTTKSSAQNQMLENAALAWEARGGDTVLCSNPSAWAATVKDYRYWRITEQYQTVSLVHVIQDIDPSMAFKVNYPGEKDDDRISNLINKIYEIVKGQKSSIPMKAILEAYENDKDKSQYNKWLNSDVKKQNRNTFEIKPQTSWEDLSQDQKILYVKFLVLVEHTRGLDLS